METATHKPPSVYLVSLLILYQIVVMSLTVYFKLPFAMSLSSVVVAAAFFAFMSGYKWHEIEQALLEGIKLGIIPAIILMTIGVLIASWMMGGIVPYMIYLGLKFLSPQIFLPATLVICCITSLATGSSWNTVGTVGIALLGVGQTIGVPLPIAVGCIVSGAWFGDKMSPLSDSTNLASAVGEVNLFDHIKHMLWTTVPALIISFILYFILSATYQSHDFNHNDLDRMLKVLQTHYHFSILYLLPPILIVVLGFFKFPILPILAVAISLGVLFGIVFEGHGVIDTIQMMNSGYQSHTGIESIDKLLSRGGLQSMADLITVVMLALGLGGIMEKTHMLEAIMSKGKSFLTNTKRIICATLVSCWFTELLLASMYLAIIIPGRMFKPYYKKLGLQIVNLTRTLEDGGTMISPIIPWGFSGIFVTATLGIPTLDYLPYAFLNLLVPIFTVLCAFTGIGITYQKPSVTD